MDFDIGNILYVVITLVAIIASLLGKKKKPAGKNAKPGFFENLEQVLKMGQEDPQVMDLQSHEPDLLYEDEEADSMQATEEITASPAVSSLLEEYESMQPDFNAVSLNEFPFEGLRSTEQMEVIELDDVDDPDYFEIVKNFDAGTAVVYSAIINRVYY